MQNARRRLIFAALLVLLALVAACKDDRQGASAPVVVESPEGTPAPIGVAPTAETAAGQGKSPPTGPVKNPAFRALPGARVEFGVHQGAAYRIELPEKWNGGLVMYAHGYRGEGPELEVSNPEIREHLVRNGYAWAASSYRANGYRPDYGADDTKALRELFVQKFGTPRWTMLYGVSMGGHVVTASLEQQPGVYQGALALCGALTGIEQIDYLAAYAAVAEYISGVNLFDAPDAQTYARRVFNEWAAAVGPASSPTERGRAFQSVVKYLLGGDLPFWREGLAARLGPGFNLVLLADPNRTSTVQGRAVDTRGVQYRIDPGLGFTAEQINRDVRRFAPAPGARTGADKPVFADLTGRIDVPLLTLHTTGDTFVPFSLEQSYRRKAAAAGAGDRLVQRAVRRPGHCEFQTAEITRAFDDLVAWMERGVRPAGDDVLTSDPDSLGLRWTSPLRPDDPARR